MITRFAPSPTGELHLGHAYSALIAWQLAQQAGGIFRLRIEDIDQARSRTAYETQIYDDLHWLGLSWPEPVMRQSERLPAYDAALAQLTELGVTYPCSCTRGDIRAALSAPQEGVTLHGPDGPLYPGTCRARKMATRKPGDAIRIDLAKVVGILAKQTVSFKETGPRHAGPHVLQMDNLVQNIGDVVLARRDIGTSYHLAVVVDDAAESISHVVRGEDLFDATPLHIILQKLLGYDTPIYHHHALIRDAEGTRLAKRDDARSLASLRANGATPADIRQMIRLEV